MGSPKKAMVVVVGVVASAYDNGYAGKPLLGWQTWCAVGKCGTDVCTDSQIRESAKALVDTGLAAKGFEWVVLDDCWHPTRDDDGTLVPQKASFPQGMAPLSAYVHSLGLKFGVYTSVGTETCRDDPGSYGHYEQDAQTFADWEVDYVKLDWCGSKRTAEGQKNFSAALNATGRPMVLELCRGDYQDEDAWGYAPDIAQIWRATGDHHDDWDSTLEQVAALENRTAWSGPHGWAYGDMLMTGGQGCDVPPESPKHCPKQTDDEYRTEISLYAILASPLLFGTDVRDFTDIMAELLLNDDLLAINQDPNGGSSSPAVNVLTSCAGFKTYVRALSDGRLAVAVPNLDDDKTTVSFCLADVVPSFATLSSSSSSWKVTDVWAKATSDATDDTTIAKKINSHDTFLVILEEEEKNKENTAIISSPAAAAGAAQQQ
mmetsp:Transcript_12440/g.40711  ORF Transcript_12440/g.40711 Transcript_12440/m.40711 type:complete len:431 (+) Transcript_12440:235-1527(+)|eukprot:CAMPEP_0118916704 /NCGR_PEP_ID=MMETSP1166-20130328/16643_1 /TAXON_ID=1104430 /ORGANISM="Chrysoreinhardia sp, Strain CCMP3193" /LENGTH=430 /DNA_ID=CAMNT_0006856613 /DNA_START=196 /DNA_END=1488 /DNA_ORIENTATION=+